MSHNRATLNIRLTGNSAFNSKRIQLSVLVINSSGTATQQPHTPVGIQVSGIARAVPDGIANVKFGFGITLPVEITG